MEQTFFPACLNILQRDCLVIGGGRDAYNRAMRLHDAGARVSVISKELTADLIRTLKSRQVEVKERGFSLTDLRQQFLVILCERRDPELTRRVASACRRKRILLCAIDQPKYCDVVNVSVYERGLLKIMISTSGASPSISRKIREGLERSLKKEPIEAFMDYLARLRKKITEGNDHAQQRAQRLIKATSGFEFKASIKYPKTWKEESA